MGERLSGPAGERRKLLTRQSPRQSDSSRKPRAQVRDLRIINALRVRSQASIDRFVPLDAGELRRPFFAPSALVRPLQIDICRLMECSLLALGSSEKNIAYPEPSHLSGIGAYIKPRTL